MLASELLSGTDSTQADEPRRLLARAVSYLPEGHGEVSARFDTGFYRVDLLHDCRERGVRFSISVPRSKAMWRALEHISEDQWQDAQESPRPGARGAGAPRAHAAAIADPQQSAAQTRWPAAR